MSPGAIPRPSRVPKQRLLSPKICLRWRRGCGNFHGWMPIDLGFSRQRHFIGGRAMLEGTRGAHTTRWHGQRGGGRQPMVWLPRCPPSSLLWTLSLCQKKYEVWLLFRLIPRIFQEYFLYNFSEIKKQQKTGTDTMASC
jgi:hypothetical protein